MKNIFKILFVSVVLIVSGCSDFLDINEDPNNPNDVTIDFILPTAQTSVAVTVGGSLHNLGGFWSQYYCQSPDAGQYENIDEYNVLSDFYNREWSEIYAGGLNDMEIIRSKAMADGDYSYNLIATLLQAYTYQMLVDIYDDIPFSTALKGATENNLSPTFDKGSDIYPALLTMIDDAVALYNDNAGDPGLDPSARDLIYGGDMGQWIGFANTLKLKMYLRMAYASPNAAAVNALLADDNFITADAAVTQFGDEQNKRNPFYEVQMDRLAGVNHRASNTMIKYLQANNDPRIDGIYIAGSGGHLAKEQGDHANRDISATVLSELNVGPVDPVYLFTLAERDFLIAEALIRYGTPSAAQAYYESGIEYSYAMHGMTGASDLYATDSVYEFKLDGDVETDIGQVMMQKWVAMANFQNLESFIETNRTHYPPVSGNAQGTPGDPGELTISYGSVLSAGQTPKRLLVPEIETSRNKNAPSQPAGGLGQKVWWDQK